MIAALLTIIGGLALTAFVLWIAGMVLGSDGEDWGDWEW